MLLNAVCGSCSSIETEIVSTQTLLSVLRVEWEVLQKHQTRKVSSWASFFLSEIKRHYVEVFTVMAA